MSSTSSISSLYSSDPSQLASAVFSRLDTGNQGYLSQNDFATALQNLGVGSRQSSTDAGNLFQALDSNGDGQLTQTEMSQGMQQLASQMEQALQSHRARHGHHHHQAEASNESNGLTGTADPQQQADPLAMLINALNAAANRSDAQNQNGTASNGSSTASVNPTAGTSDPAKTFQEVRTMMQLVQAYGMNSGSASQAKA